VTSVVITPATATLHLATSPTTQLTATCKDASNTAVPGRTIIWTSSDTLVARVDANGLVTAKAVGTAQITATAQFDGVSSAVKAVITVQP